MLFDIRATECDAVCHRRDELLYSTQEGRREFVKKPYAGKKTAVHHGREREASSSLSLSS